MIGFLAVHLRLDFFLDGWGSIIVEHVWPSLPSSKCHKTFPAKTQHPRISPQLQLGHKTSPDNETLATARH